MVERDQPRRRTLTGRHRRASLRLLLLVAMLAGLAVYVGQGPGITSASADTPGCGVLAPGASAEAKAAVNKACGLLGTPYSWGGGHGSEPGPSYGICDPDNGAPNDCNVKGLDCSGMVRYAYYLAVGADVINGTSRQQWQSDRAVAKFDRAAGLDPLLPGDLLFFGDSAESIHHVAIYIGQGHLVEAPYSGGVVRVAPVDNHDDYFGAIRLYDGRAQADRDVSGDGFADILTIDGGDGKLRYYPNQIGVDPAAPFGNATWASAAGTWSAAKASTSGDVSGDGHADILSVGSDGRLYYYPNNIKVHPDAPFTGAAWKSEATWDEFRAVSAGDISGDGHADLLAIGADDRLYYYPNNIKTHPEAPFTNASWKSEPTWGDVKAISAGDISGDKHADLMAIGNDDRLYYYPNGIKTHPEAPFTGAAWKSEPTWGKVTSLYTGHISGDNHADLLAIDSDGSLYYYPNNMSSGDPFTKATWRTNPTWSENRLLG